MKSKSPFPKKSPLGLQVYQGDTYEQPDTVITKTIGEQVGKAITGIADNAADYMDLKGKIAYNEKPEPRKKAEIAGAITPGRGEVKSRGFSKAGELTSITDQKIKMIGQKDKVTEKQAWENRDTNKYPPGSEEKFVKDMKSDSLYGTSGGKGISTTLSSTSIYGDGNLISKSPYNKKGSPAKHNESAVGSIAGAQPQGQSAISLAGSMLGGKSMAGIRAIGQKPTDSAQSGGGMFAAAAQAAGGLREFASQNKAYQESLPPPNQVAESGSYAGTGERILEMDSNTVGNQSIGRNTDVASQLFGSGQRASMLAMKGFAKPEEELIDETKFEELPKENTMGYNVQDITSIKTDENGREYMVDIETRKDTIHPAQGDIKFPRLKSKNKGRTFNR